MNLFFSFHPKQRKTKIPFFNPTGWIQNFGRFQINFFSLVYILTTSILSLYFLSPSVLKENSLYTWCVYFFPKSQPYLSLNKDQKIKNQESTSVLPSKFIWEDEKLLLLRLLAPRCQQPLHLFNQDDPSSCSRCSWIRPCRFRRRAAAAGWLGESSLDTISE